MGLTRPDRVALDTGVESTFNVSALWSVRAAPQEDAIGTLVWPPRVPFQRRHAPPADRFILSFSLDRPCVGLDILFNQRVAVEWSQVKQNSSLEERNPWMDLVSSSGLRDSTAKSVCTRLSFAFVVVCGWTGNIGIESLLDPFCQVTPLSSQRRLRDLVQVKSRCNSVFGDQVRTSSALRSTFV